MTYTTGHTILAADYNALGWTNPSIAGQWGVGSGSHGLGQNTSPISQLSGGKIVSSAKWTSLIQTTNKCLAHEGQTLIVPGSVSTGKLVASYSSVSTGVAASYNNAGITGLSLSAGSTTTTTYSTSWGAQSLYSLQCTQTVTFSSGDAARYFFNAGGNISISYSRAGGSSNTTNTNWSNLCSACGTYVLGYNNDYKVGGSGSPSNLTHLGYWGLTTSSTEHFRQYDTASGYTGDYISVSASWSGTPSNGGYPTITFVITMMNASTITVDGTAAFNITANYPSTTYLTNTWGTATLGGTITYASTGVIAPVNTSIPVISGTTTLGQTLSSTTGTWANSPTGYTYQWYRSGSPIGGATGSSYTLVSADVGTTITSHVTASNTAGSATAISAATATIAGLAPVNTSIPVISGTTMSGSTLSTTDGTWNYSPTSYTYQWYRSGSPIGGATGNSYVLTTSDIGYTISAGVTASNAYGSGNATSANTAAITGAGTIANPIPGGSFSAEDHQYFTGLDADAIVQVNADGNLYYTNNPSGSNVDPGTGVGLMSSAGAWLTSGSASACEVLFEVVTIITGGVGGTTGAWLPANGSPSVYAYSTQNPGNRVQTQFTIRIHIRLIGVPSSEIVSSVISLYADCDA